MRINKFIALATGMSRRASDEVIFSGRVRVNGNPTSAGYSVTEYDSVTLDDTLLAPPKTIQTICLNKPPGYVCSRNGQGNNTIYDILPMNLHHLKPVGRLDKDSSGLILLTNDGQLAHDLTHPSRQKIKVYEVTLDKQLAPLHQQMVADFGVHLSDGLSSFSITKIDTASHRHDADMQRTGKVRSPLNIYQITMHEGRNRQIRRTFAALGYTVKALHRTQFGSYSLGTIAPGKYITL